MKRALDKTEVGVTKEIDIENVKEYKKKGRFYCINCGEKVFAAIGNRRYFSHKKKGELDCKLRVNVYGNSSYQQKTGLPLYLSQDCDKFKLCVGFPGLSSEIIEEAGKHGVQIVVESSGREEKFFIDSVGFSKNLMNLRPLKFFPNYNTDYSMRLTNSESDVSRVISKSWPDYSIGFNTVGALFNYSEGNCRRIRDNDVITVNTNYYYLSFNTLMLPTSSLNIDRAGTISLNNTDYQVFKINIFNRNIQDFEELEKFLLNNMKIHLEYKKPRIEQVWPPYIKNNDINMNFNCSKWSNGVFCKVVSDTPDTEVYRYDEHQHYKIQLRGDSYNNLFFTTKLSNKLEPFSVNRIYLANMTYFQSFNYERIGSKYNILLRESHLCYSSTKVISQNEIELTSDSELKISIVLLDSKLHYEVLYNREGFFSITAAKFKDSLIFVYSQQLKRLILIMKNVLQTEAVVQNFSSEVNLRNYALRHINDTVVNIPLKYQTLVREVIRDYNLYYLLNRNLSKGMLQKSILDKIIRKGK